MLFQAILTLFSQYLPQKCERSNPMEEKKRGRPPRYQPTWKDGQESRQEEALWPYATCIIANRLVRTQNIGTLKAMARDKAINIKGDVFVDVILPGGQRITFAFDKHGQQRRV